MNKVIREGDGAVAVLISPDFGAGWSTWAAMRDETMLFCPELVKAVLGGHGIEYQMEIVARLFPDVCNLGLYDGLAVEWVPAGVRFIVHEYDGSESVWREDEMGWITA